MRISIVIPNYNSGEVLERAIRSLLAQDYPDLQLILADSESRDVSREIIERYRGAFDVVLCKKDKGQADGLNNGFAHAGGDIFGWLCADDELVPGALHHVADLFRRHPDADVVTGYCRRIYPDGSPFDSPPDPEAWDKIHTLDVIEQPSTFWKGSLHRRLGLLDTSYHLAFDWDLWCRMRLAGARLVTTDAVLSRYYFSATNKSGSAGDLFAREAFRIIRKYGPLRGRLAYIFRFLYRHFDLHGCYDQPPAASPARMLAWGVVLRTLRIAIGEKLLYRYNWHFASCQQRGMRWW
ncbi:MAG TPA: glycosyltransferase family 2 protein [Bryobacteraceae bacterium]|nr:glycosyltransferase family 2 protein [Bryobacteraceae bacterium]